MINRARRPAAILSMLLAVLVLSACGKKGPLYLPDHTPPPAPATVPAAPPAPSELPQPAQP